MVFLAAGLPAFFVAIPLNYCLVELAHFPKPLAYAVALLFQVIVNFFMCRWLVFTSGTHKTIGRQFLEFVVAILTFRLTDWAVYAFLVEIADLHYLAVQIFNVVIFAVLKFKLSRRIIEG